MRSGIGWVILATCATTPAAAQVTRASGWVVSAGAHIDLWYHGMALVGTQTHSALPMYNHDHVRVVTAAKRAAGVYPTELDREADEIREEIEKYPTLAFLHFVPAYFPHATPQRMLHALRRAADGDDAGAARADVALGIDAVGRALRSSKERNALRRFVDLLESEWSTFYAVYWRDREAATMAAVERAQSVVDELVSSSMAANLTDWRLQSGAVFVSAPVGPNGRIFAGDPQNPADNVVIVRLPPARDDPGMQAALSIPRELCFPQVDASVEALRIGQMDRYEAEQAAGRGAVRCGELLIDAHVPRLSQSYRDAFVETATGLTVEEFAAVFAVPARLEERIRSLVAQR